MTVTPSQINAGRTFATVLAERGTLPITPTLALVRSLALQIADLHDAGMVHGAIGPAAIMLDDRDVPRLEPPASGTLLQLAGDWAGLFSDLSRLEPVTLPVSVGAARQRFQEVGITLDPRQIDLRQLGALWCRVLTGESIAAYLRSPRVKGLVPTELRPLLERMLGAGGSERFANMQDFLRALDAAAGNFDSPPTISGSEVDLSEDAAAIAPTPTVPTSDTTPSFAPSQNQPADTSVMGVSPSAAQTQKATSDDPDDALPFAQLGHYEIVRRIGRGGMGDVYLGYERALDRKVAIKVLPADLARSDEFVRRFKAEATAAARLIHPNIIQIHFIGAAEGHHYFAMQFVEGESLADLLQRRGKLTVDETLAIVEQALAGLSAAHEQNMVHRDIKPGNILLDSRHRRALLADFGLVKSLESSVTGKTATGVVMGTVDYISPEQGRGQTVDGRSDLYSIGVLLYRMLSGRLPFTADNPTALIFQHVFDPPPKLSQTATHVPETLAQVVARLLAKSPADRHQTAAELLADFRAIRAGGPLPAKVRNTPGRNTAIIRLPTFDEEPLQISSELATLQPPHWWDLASARVLSLFRRHAPEVLQRLQNTQQQVDGAVAVYERRQRELQHLADEAEAMLQELMKQAGEQRAAAVAAGQRAQAAPDQTSADRAQVEVVQCEREAVELDRQIADQQEQLGPIRLRLAQARAKVQELGIQRDILKARLKAAGAWAHVQSGAGPGRRRWNPALVFAGGLCVTAMAFLVISFIGRNSKLTDESGLRSVVAQSAPVVSANGTAEPVSRADYRPVREADGAYIYDLKSCVRVVVFGPNVDQLARTRFAAGTADGKVLMFIILRGEPSGLVVDAQHDSAVNAIAFSPTEYLCASAGDDKVIQLWPTQASEQKTRRLAGHSAAVRALAFTADGTRLLSGGDDQQIRLWDVQTANEIDHIGVAGPVTSLALSADGAHCLVSHSKGSAPAAVTRVDLSTRKATLTIPTDGLAPLAVALPRVGSLGFSVQNGNSPLLVWNGATGERIGTLGKSVALAAVQADGLRALTADANGAVTLWNAETGQPVQEFAAATSPLTSLAISVNGHFGMSGCADGTLRVRKLSPPAETGTVLYTDAPLACVAIAPSGNQILAGGVDQIQIWRGEDSSPGKFRDPSTHKIAADATSVKFFPDELAMIYATSTRQSADHVVAINRSQVFGQLSLSVHNRERDLTEFRGHTDRITTIDCSRRRLISASLDGTVRAWNLASPPSEPLTLSIGSPVHALALSPLADDLVLVGSNETNLQLWDLSRQERVREFRGMTRGIHSVGFSEDGKRVMAGGADRTVRVWDAGTSLLLATLIGHTGAVNATAFLEQGRFAFSGSDDGTVRFWSIDQNRQVARLTGHWGPVRGIAVSPREDFAVSGSDDRTLRIWKTPGS